MRSSQRRYGRANPTQQPVSSSLSAKRGHHSSDRLAQANQAFRGSPLPLPSLQTSLTDSNRRRPPYHVLLAATAENKPKSLPSVATVATTGLHKGSIPRGEHRPRRPATPGSVVDSVGCAWKDDVRATASVRPQRRVVDEISQAPPVELSPEGQLGRRVASPRAAHSCRGREIRSRGARVHFFAHALLLPQSSVVTNRRRRSARPASTREATRSMISRDNSPRLRPSAAARSESGAPCRASSRRSAWPAARRSSRSSLCQRFDHRAGQCPRQESNLCTRFRKPLALRVADSPGRRHNGPQCQSRRVPGALRRRRRSGCSTKCSIPEHVRSIASRAVAGKLQLQPFCRAL